ncbi:MAG: Hsp20/alpha crystallin family protein [Halobacteriota archaeon]
MVNVYPPEKQTGKGRPSMGYDKHERAGDKQEEPKGRGAFPAARCTLEEVRSSVGDLIGRIQWPLWWPWAPIEPFAEEPEIDIVDLDGEFKVTIDLPGVAKEDIEVCATRDGIELAAVKTEARAQSKAKYVSKERGCTSYKRVLALSDEVIPDETEASFENGILTLVLKKRPLELARERVRVEIK